MAMLAATLSENTGDNLMPRSNQPPSLAEIISATIAMRTEFDNSKREALARALHNATGGNVSDAGVAVPPTIARSLLPDTRPFAPGTQSACRPSRERAWGILRAARAVMEQRSRSITPPFVADRARTTFGVCDLLNWWPVKTREYKFPAVQESSRATGSRWGGIQATWGLNETTLPAATDGKVSQATFDNTRLLIYSTVSRDVWEDSESLERWLSYIAMSEIRFSIELAVVQGVLNGPTGIIGEPCTVTVPKGSTVQFDRISQHRRPVVRHVRGQQAKRCLVGQ